LGSGVWLSTPLLVVVDGGFGGGFGLGLRVVFGHGVFGLSWGWLTGWRDGEGSAGRGLVVVVFYSRVFCFFLQEEGDE